MRSNAVARALTKLALRHTALVLTLGLAVAVAGITYHGPINGEGKLAEMYAACDVFVAPSLGGESFGIVLLEAMAAARPIVCSDIAGYRFAVGEGPGSGARLVAPGDAAGLVREIEALATATE
ncbi:MAG TPA: glycosyltransferase family 4 protein, partial [Kofleriaceae bacterium]|nr:glycosyltransferase family 4 protein [Kofleriaceae bacterium]